MFNLVAQELAENGFIFLRGYMPDLNSAEVFKTLGDVVKLPIVSEVQVLKPNRREQSSPNTYSGNFGLEEFPLHTDLAHWFLPPRYLSLRCVMGTREVATYLLDSRDLVNDLGESTLGRTLVRPRRPVERLSYLLRLYGPTDDGESLFRWDSLFIRPATEASASTYKSVSNLITTKPKTCVHLQFVGDTLIVDNWRMLHGRSEITDDARSRHIERTYFRALK